MTVTLHSTYFFDLSDFSHRILFEELQYPWLVLSMIESYIRSQSLGKHKGNISSQAYLVHPELISIGEGSVVEPGAYIQGPCLIGENCIVRHGAYVRGNVITGNHCVIGHDSEIKNSILLNHTHAVHFAYVGDSILGNRVNLGAGTKCANLKLDNKKIAVHFNGQKIQTPLRKFGVILGDGTQIGCNSVTNPGTLMGQEVKCYPCINVGGFIPSYSVVKPQIKLTIEPYK